MKIYAISLVSTLFVFLFLFTGCSPRLASVSTGGLLSRSYENYSQSTVVRSELMMRGQQQQQRGGEQTQQQTQVIYNQPVYSEPVQSHYAREVQAAPQRIKTPTGTTQGRRATVIEPEPARTFEVNVAENARGVAGGGIPKASNRRRAGVKNVTFVARSVQQLAHVDATVAPTAEVSQVPQVPVQPENPATTAPTQVAMTTQQAAVQERVVIPQQQQMTAKELKALQKRQKAETKRKKRGLINRLEGVKKPVANAGVVIRTEPGSEDREVTTERAGTGLVAVGSTVITEEGEEEQGDGEVRLQQQQTTVKREQQEAVVGNIPSNFTTSEMEHVKFAEYDPFGNGNNRLTIVLSEQDFCWPYHGKFMSAYGMRGRRMHTGIDLSGPANDTVRAAFGGVVRMSKYYSSYGNCVVVRHANGLETLYAHNSRNLVNVGDYLLAGQPVGLVGRTGRATGNHCHFEVRIQGRHINPLLVLNHEKERIQDGVLVVNRGSAGNIMASNRSSGIATGGEEGYMAAPNRMTAGTTTGTSTGTTVGTGTSYTVRSGDSLWTIARRYGTTVSKICNLNGISAQAKLMPGKKLTIR